MKKKWFLISLVLLFTIGWGRAESMNGYWVGFMEMNGKRVDISISLTPQGGTMSSEDLMFLERPLSKVVVKEQTIGFSWIDDIEIAFQGKMEQGKMLGTVNIPQLPPSIGVTFSLTKQKKAPFKNYSIDKLRVQSSGATLDAEIYRPKSKQLHPAIILLHGSSMGLKQEFNCYADIFVKLGFEVLIFDKRGFGESSGNRLTASYENLAVDAIACLNVLKNRKTVDPKRIGLWGLSQGGMLIPFVASKTDIPSFLIAVVPEVNGVAEAAAYSDSLRVLKRGFSKADSQIVIKSHRTVAEMIQRGCGYKEVELLINQNAQNFPFMKHTGLYGGMKISPESFVSI